MNRRAILPAAVFVLVLTTTALSMRSSQEGSGDLTSLATQRRDIARRQYEDIARQFKTAPPPSGESMGETVRRIVEPLALWSRRWADADADLGDPSAALRSHVARMRTWEDGLKQVLAGGSGVSQADYESFKFHRLEGEYALAKLKTK
jgi:hypothetical protein